MGSGRPPTPTFPWVLRSPRISLAAGPDLEGSRTVASSTPVRISVPLTEAPGRPTRCNGMDSVGGQANWEHDANISRSRRRRWRGRWRFPRLTGEWPIRCRSQPPQRRFPRRRFCRLGASMDKTGWFLVTSAIVIPLLTAWVARSATHYSARLQGEQKRRDAELKQLSELRDALLDALVAVQSYVMYVEKTERVHTITPEVWAARRPLFEPALQKTARLDSLALALPKSSELERRLQAT